MLYGEILKMDENTNLNTQQSPIDFIPNSASTLFKYNEEEIVKELLDYIRGTYRQHYSAGDDEIQTLDLKGTARRDIMKILHYAVLLMHFNDKNAKREIYPQ
jgi:hypothetical protein